MAEKFISYTEHAVAGSTELLATHNGAHIRDIRAAEDIDNGCIVGKGAYETFHTYAEAEAEEFTGTILGKSARGYWYVECKTAKNAWLVLTTPLIYANYTHRMQDEANFYNAAGDLMRCYELYPNDVFELSPIGFEGEPVEGASVTVSNKKVTIA